MTDATILVPTFSHPAYLPYALRSAQGQEDAEVEIFVVGDGVDDHTRNVLASFSDDPRVRFFDFPKGERHGEAHRHDALREASGLIVCYLSDDDLLLRSHVAEMRRLLEDADFAHSSPFFVNPDGSLDYGPVDVSRPDFQARLLGGWNTIGLTGAAHTLDAYRRLPHGWRPAPAGIWTDLYMWQQLLRIPGFRGRTSTCLTHLHFPDSQRRKWTVAERVAELERWWSRMQEPSFGSELADAVAATAQRFAVAREGRVHDLETRLETMQSTRWWRLRTWAATSQPLRALRARRGAAR